MSRTSKYLIALAMVCAPVLGYAQITFQNLYVGHGFAVRHPTVEKFPGGGFVIGLSGDDPLPSSDVELIRTDQLGDTLWMVHYGGWVSAEYVNDLSIAPDGGIGVVATMDYWTMANPPQDDILILRTDSLGVLQWSVVVDVNGNDEACSIEATSDGGFIVSGTANYYSSPFVIKVSSTGAVQWMRNFTIAGSINTSSAKTIACANGDYAMICEVTDSSFNRSTVVTRLNASGNQIWQNEYTSGNWFAGVAIAETYYSELVFCCRDDYSTWNTKMYSVTSISPWGAVLWSTICSVNTNHDFYPEDIRVAGSTDIWLCGGLLQYSYHGGFVSRFSRYGVHFSTAVYTNGTTNWFNSIDATEDGGCVMAGIIDTLGAPACYVVKTNDIGLSGCNSQTMLPYAGSQLVTVSAVASSIDSVYNASAWLQGPPYSSRTKFELCPTVVSVPENAVTSSVTYNSISSMLVFDELMSGTLICIYDITGKLVKRELINTPTQEICCSDLACGVYTYLLFDANSTGIAGKFVKE